MKIVKLIGGLGNQMFQYAFFISLQSKGLATKIDISEFEDYSLHQGLELEKVFDIDLKQYIPTQDELDRIKDKNKYFNVRRFWGNIIFSNPNQFIKKSHFIQPNFSQYYSNIYTTEDRYLDGYWQNENYLKSNENQIRELFHWSEIGKRNSKLEEMIERGNSVSIHIRRFDKPHNFSQFLYRLKLSLVWRVASREYYLKSINYITRNLEHPKFYVFTDNIEWVKKNIPLNVDFIIVDWNRGDKSNLDMYLMSKCKHNIISMSSFSWWGAWLNSNKKKIVIAPKKWALRFSKDHNLIPETWIRL